MSGLATMMACEIAVDAKIWLAWVSERYRNVGLIF